MPITDYAENKMLDAVFNGVAFSVPNTYIKLHIGDPGEAGTANAAAHTTRVLAGWSTAVSGAVSNDNIVTFTPLAANEVISYVSVWDALTNGNAIWYGPLTAPQSVNSGGTLNFAIGAISITLE